MDVSVPPGVPSAPKMLYPRSSVSLPGLVAVKEATAIPAEDRSRVMNSF